MRPDFNNLTAAEAERLAHLIEELAEAQQAACKVLRHGYASYDPTDPTHLGNRRDLENELSDVLGAIQRMADARDVQELPDARSAMALSNRYMHHQASD